MEKDTKIVRKRRWRRTKGKVGRQQGDRKPTTCWSPRSRAKALEHLRNTTGYVSWLTLTFPYPVNDDKEAKAALEKIGLWLIRHGASYYWKIEFRDGKPHFHLLTTKHVNESELQVAWGHVLGQEHVSVKVGEIYDYEELIGYAAKFCENDQNQVPDTYRNMGHFWGTRGPKAKPNVHLGITGDPSKVAKAIRQLKKLERANGAVRRKDLGHVGMTLKDVGGEAVAESVRKTLDL